MALSPPKLDRRRVAPTFRSSLPPELALATRRSVHPACLRLAWNLLSRAPVLPPRRPTWYDPGLPYSPPAKTESTAMPRHHLRYTTTSYDPYSSVHFSPNAPSAALVSVPPARRPVCMYVCIIESIRTRVHTTWTTSRPAAVSALENALYSVGGVGPPPGAVRARVFQHEFHGPSCLCCCCSLTGCLRLQSEVRR